MRLTLRALLAYLDDVLEPAQSKEIGLRVSESPPAASTVARIKEVVRRRRIAAPELAGTGSAPDPNLVAEYLDNTLSPESVTALEKLCLDSDMHLAEVASSHQILTAVLGEPIDVPLVTRERMYALQSAAPPVTQPPVVETPHQSSTEGVAGAGQPLPRYDATSSGTRPPMRPDYLQPTIGRKILLGGAAVVLVGGWLTWVLWDQGVLKERPLATNAEALPAADVEAVADDSAAVATIEPSPTLPMPLDEQNTINFSDSVAGETRPVAETALSKVDDSLPLAVQPAENGSLPEKMVVNSEVAVVPAVVPPAAEPPLVPPVIPDVPASQFPAALYSSVEGILISRNIQEGQWNVMPRRSMLHPEDEIASPEPFTSVISVGNSELELTLYGGSRLKFHSGRGPQLFVLDVDRGRIALRRSAASEGKEPVTLGLVLRGQPAQLALLEPGTVCGLEVSQHPPQGKRPDGLLTMPEGGVSVATGAISLTWAGGEPVLVDSDLGWAAWPAPQNSMKAGPVRAIPAWLAPEGVSLTAADKKVQTWYEKEFSIDQPVSASIPALVPDRREGISDFATETLALVDDVPNLVKALQSEHDKTRVAAIRGIRAWLPTDPNNNAILEMEVARIFPDEDISDIVELLWGFSLADARDEVVSRRLLKWMDHGELAIRELAYFHVSQLTGRGNAHGYRPTLPDAARNAALMGWHAQLERNGGKLLK